MPTESFINLTEGSGKKVHAISRTIGANTVYDMVAIPGEANNITYQASFTAISIATSGSHVVQLMAGSSKRIVVRRIYIEQYNSASAATTGSFSVLRLSTAGTGGTSVTPASHQDSDAAAEATAMTLPSSAGTEGDTLNVLRVGLSVSASRGFRQSAEWRQHPGTKGIVIPPGTANGIAIKCAAAYTSATLNGCIEFIEIDWAV